MRKQSECQCMCHTPGLVAMHIMPCCVPDEPGALTVGVAAVPPTDSEAMGRLLGGADAPHVGYSEDGKPISPAEFLERNPERPVRPVEANDSGKLG